MSSPASYNRRAVGRYWNLIDIPEEWPGYAILLRGDLDRDVVLDDEELDNVDWIAFSEAVEDFQQQAGLTPLDGKLGPNTLGSLQKVFTRPSPGVLKQLGDDLVFRPAEVPVSEPPGPELVGRTSEERRICSLWNRYGRIIHQQAAAHGLSTHSALAVFSVESGAAYDATTGLLIIRFEPHIFERRSGHSIEAERGGQNREWSNLTRAYDVDREAALLSCSYGLPQLMGFNWQVTAHQSPREMVLAFQKSCEEQVKGFFGFISANKLLEFIESEDWLAFTRRYNGPGNVDVYSGRLIRALKVVDSLRQDGAVFEIV